MIEILFPSLTNSNTVMATKFCTWCDGCAVVVCTKFCWDVINSNGITGKWKSRRIWIAVEKSLISQMYLGTFSALQWRYNECDGVSNHRHLVCLLNRFIKEDIKVPRQWPLWGESTDDRWFPSQRGSNAENISIWWRHHGDQRYI